MDVWVVAAAAGAGYVVQHLKNLGRGKNKWVDSSSENLNGVRPQSSRSRRKLGDKTGPFDSVLSRESNGEEMSNGEGDKVCDFEMTSTSGYEDENMVVGGSFMSSSFLAQNPDVEDVQGDLESGLPFDSSRGFTSDMSPRHSSSEIVFSSSSSRRRRGLKSRRFDSQSIKPQTSLQSCLMAQLYEERDASEEYAHHSLEKPRLRPFLVTDGSRIISSAPCESVTVPIGTSRGERWLRKDGYSQVNSTVCGIPALPNIEPAECGKKAKTSEKQKRGFEGYHSSKASRSDPDNAQGTSSKALLFNFGLTLGVASSFMANKHEVEKMKSLLKQNENLVQDLQEELEMKDCLTVKELAADNNESTNVNNDYCTDDTVLPLSLKEKSDEKSCHEKPEEQSLYAIEAELEVELQRLESSMNSSSLEGKLCNLSGFDPDFVSDFHEGMLRSRSFAAEFHGDSDESRSSTPRSCPYPVSPRELSLRLHQVIQSRLEERIKELETALQNSQQKSKYMGSKHVHPWRELSSPGTRNSSAHDSPIARNEHKPMDEPVVISLSGEALAAYNEAYDVFTKVSESDEEDFQAGFENGYHAEYDSNEVQETVFHQRTEEDLYSPQNNNALGRRRDEVEDCDEDDEIERLLIRQIVEKAKQGSPAVLKAQREFLLLNIENEH
ncbi:hypothetical protein AAHA92_31801 [Salvia divinorum]|uniref:Uncharacterized protein n=1 Tax=Salvia divinorum TaxID=28513 RepID=A0ABD1FIL3_SALDI